MPAIDHDWSKPAAMAIPKEGYFELERGRYGPIYPEDSRLLRVFDHREGQRGPRGGNPRVRQGDRGRGREPARTCWRRCGCTICGGSLFDIGSGLHFQYQGIFDTDFDKYTEDAVKLFTAIGRHDGLHQPRRVPRGLEGEPGGVHQVRPRTPMSQLPGVRGVSLRHRR